MHIRTETNEIEKNVFRENQQSQKLDFEKVIKISNFLSRQIKKQEATGEEAQITMS